MTDDVETDDLTSLREAYCPPLDEALFYAITSDYDISTSSGRSELTRALDSLKGGAVVEQELEMLPEVSTGNDNHKSDGKVANSSHIDDKTQSSKPSELGSYSTTDEDGVNSITTGISGLAYSQEDDDSSYMRTGYGEAGDAFEFLSKEKKTEWLQTMFPSVARNVVESVLLKSDHKFDRSTDELLNLAFLKTSDHEPHSSKSSAPKGIDAFMVSDHQNKLKRKARNRRKQNLSELETTWTSDSAISSGAQSPVSASSNMWSTASQDVQFIASRTYLKPKAIASVYHANGAKMAPTIRALAIKEGEKYTKAPEKTEDIMQWQTEELKAEFERVPFPQIYGMLLLANRIPSIAKELLESMVTSQEEPVMLGKINGLASYTPVDLSEDEGVMPRSASTLSATLPVGPGAYTTSHLANAHGVAATQAYQQASTAYRRGKSDHLMGGAAAYYASVGHEHLKAAKSLQASAADAHVARQSSTSTLDLHGVNVADAVRIARQNTEAWWDGLLDRKYVVGGIGNGYRIVTGVGRHSSDGIGRIGPAVSKMLVREGWKVQINSGELIVLGKVRKK